MQKVLVLISILFLSNIAVALSSDVTVYKLDDGMCGELSLNNYIAKFAIQFGGVTKGNCADINYTVFDHEELVPVGPFGNFKVTIYRKEGEKLNEKNTTEFTFIKSVLKNVTGDCVTVYKIDDGKCGELCLSAYIAKFAIQFGGVTKGNCKDIDYTVFDHKEKVSVGPFGSFEVTIYRKEGESLKFLDEKKTEFNFVKNFFFGSKNGSQCDEECKGICCRNGGGEACVTACGCSMPC